MVFGLFSFNISPLIGIDEASESEEESEEEKQNEEETKEEEEEEEGKKTPVQTEKKKKKGEVPRDDRKSMRKYILFSGLDKYERPHMLHLCAFVIWVVWICLCVTDSSGESDSSDDSDIEGETASALFMVSVCVCDRNGYLCIL